MSIEKVRTVGKNRATMPLSDFVLKDGLFGPPADEFYVDGNVLVTGRGTASHPFKTLAEAITASDASITLAANRFWARRNRIYVVGDTLTETLVKFPTKCDIIGCGSYDANTMPGLVGHHVPIGESYGTRWFNFKFNSVALAAPIFTLTSASSGMEFHGCIFDGNSGTMTIGIQATAHPGLVVNDCDFVGTFVTSYMTFGTGQAGRTRITNNRMLGATAIGIVAGSGMTSSWHSLIDNNIIYAVGRTIDDDSDLFFVTNNRLMTDANIATTTAGYDFLLARSSGNILTGDSGVAAEVPFAVDAE